MASEVTLTFDEDLTEKVLLQRGALEFVNGQDFREGTRLADGVELVVSTHNQALIAYRILGTQEGVRLDPELEPPLWQARRVA